MSQKIIRNPSEVPITETSRKNPTTMASTKNKAINEFSHQAKTAAYILGGQALAAQFNGIAVPMVLKGQSSTIQQIARAGIPLATGIALALGVKNKYVRGLSLGFGTQGVLEAIKLVMPNFAPSEGFSDGSHFLYTAEDGTQRQAAITPDGKVVTQQGVTHMLPESSAAQSQNPQSKPVNGQAGAGELSGWQDESHYTDHGMEMEQV